VKDENILKKKNKTERKHILRKYFISNIPVEKTKGLKQRDYITERKVGGGKGRTTT
jgi:hypothetical protein